VSYSIQKEDENLEALLKKTGAHYVFGTANEALFALHATLILPAIHKVTLYEPVLFVGQPGLEQFEATIQRYAKEIAESKLVAAMVALTKGVNIKLINYFIPDFLLEQVFKLYIWIDARNVKGNDISGKELLPTLHFEFQIVKETEGTLENYKNVSAEALLLNGSKSDPLIKDTLNALKKVLPHSNRIELQGLNHDSAQDYGKPEIITQELKRFFQ